MDRGRGYDPASAMVWRGRAAAVGAICLLALAAQAAPVRAQSAGGPFCPGVTSTAGLPQPPAPPLRFGISPGVQTGQLGTGPVPPRTPENPARQLSALSALVPPGVPFVLRLTRLFWSDGDAGVTRYVALARRYTSAGYLVEIQLRYHPSAADEGDIAAWTSYVRGAVDRLGAVPGVVGLQVANEVNLADSADSSDGVYRGGRDALIQGVIVAKDEARRRGFSRLTVGFNWADRTDPQSDASFWAYLRDNGGPAFRAALDWIALDAYPGTFFPPAEAPGREGDGLINGASALRCYAQSAGIPGSVPMRIEENGYPTAPTPDRSYARQADALRTMVTAAAAYRGTYNISDYRWFDLRDSDSTSPNFQQQYGLMTDLYAPKPAFGAYHDLIAALSARAGPSAGATAGAARPRLVLRCRRGRIVARLSRAAAVAAVSFRHGRTVARRTRPPFAATLPGRSARVTAVVALRGAAAARLSARAPACSRPHPRFTG